jgi:NAD(P) transhydrogenase subunit beta
VKILNESVVLTGYLVAAILFILALKGLSSPRKARRANRLGAAGAVIAISVYVLGHDIRNGIWIALAVLVGTAIAVPAARRV